MTEQRSGMAIIEELYQSGKITKAERDRLAKEHLSEVYGIAPEPSPKGRASMKALHEHRLDDLDMMFVGTVEAVCAYRLRIKRMRDAGEELCAAVEAALEESEGNDDRIVGETYERLRDAITGWWGTQEHDDSGYGC